MFWGKINKKGVIFLKLPELKEAFYKRYNSSDNYLHFTSNGLLCTLLGHCELENTPSLTCTLSMRVQMFARALDGGMIKLQSSTEDKCLVYIFGTPAELFRGGDKETVKVIQMLDEKKIRGAQILYDCSIPKFLSKKEAFSISLIQSLMKVSGIDADALETAALSSCSESVVPYLATVSAKSGYCTLLSSGIPKNYPLPLSGYKILSAHCTEKERDRSKPVRTAFDNIRRIYPHIGSAADITPEMFNSAKASIKDKTALRYMYHLINENTRIKAVTAALKRCDTRTLFREMNNSQKSMERFWDIGSEHTYLARCALGLDGIAAVRCWKNGIVAIIEEDKIDHAIGLIRQEFESNIGYQPTFCVSETV